MQLVPGERQQELRCAVKPCSAALARQIHHPDPRHVISWGLENTAAADAADTGNHFIKGGIITSIFNIHTHYRAHCTHTYSWSESARPILQGHRPTHPLSPQYKRVAQCITSNQCQIQQLSTKSNRKKTVYVTLPPPPVAPSETNLQTPAKATSDCSTSTTTTTTRNSKLVHRLTSWLAALQNKAPIVWNL